MKTTNILICCRIFSSGNDRAGRHITRLEIEEGSSLAT
jgi:hypothetical protein